MSDRIERPSDGTPEGGSNVAARKHHHQSPDLPREQFLGLVLAVAAGETAIPVDGELSPGQAHALGDEVQRIRRARLISYIARQITLRLHRERQCDSPGKGVSHD